MQKVLDSHLTFPSFCLMFMFESEFLKFSIAHLISYHSVLFFYLYVYGKIP